MTRFAANRPLLIALFALALPVFLIAASGGGLTWDDPSDWKVVPSGSSMRAVTYEIPAASGESEAGECAVFYFGPGQGGGVQANIRRWIGQFRAPGGGPADDLAETGKKTINGLPVTIVSVSGTYMKKERPMARKATPMPGYRMLAAIVEGPQGSVFFKLTAPEKTADEAEPAFRNMLQSISK